MHFIYTYIIYINLIYKCSASAYLPHFFTTEYAQEFLRLNWYTEVVTQEFWHRSSCTEAITLDLLHKSCCTAVAVQQLLHRSYLLVIYLCLASFTKLQYLKLFWFLYFKWQAQGQPSRVHRKPTHCEDYARTTYERVVKCDFSVEGPHFFAQNNGRRSLWNW